AAGTLVGLGPHSVAITVADASGNSSACTTSFTVTDTTPPVVNCPVAATASAGANGQAAVPDFLTALTASDNCTPAAQLVKTQTPAAGTLVGVGPHSVAITVADASGNSSACTSSFTVADTTPPVVN